jgi:hypothetical protein
MSLLMLLNGETVVPWYLSGGILPGNCVAAYQPQNAANYTTSKINLANPGTYDAAEGSAPSWDSVNGWKFVSTHYLTTGIIPVAGWSYICRTCWTDTPALYAWGQNGDGTSSITFMRFSGFNTFYANGEATNDNALALGTADVKRVLGMRGQARYIDGVKDAVDCPAWTGGNNALEILMGALTTTDVTKYRGNIQTFSIYNTILTEAQLQAVSSAMLNLDIPEPIPPPEAVTEHVVSGTIYTEGS